MTTPENDISKTGQAVGDPKPASQKIVKALGDVLDAHENAMTGWSFLSVLVILDKCGLLDESRTTSSEHAELKQSLAVLLRETEHPLSGLPLTIISEIERLLAPYAETSHPLGAIPQALSKISSGLQKMQSAVSIEFANPDTGSHTDPTAAWLEIAAIMESNAMSSWENFGSDHGVNELIGNTLAHSRHDSVIDLHAGGGHAAAAFASPETEIFLIERNPCHAVIAAARVLIAGTPVEKLGIHIGHYRNEMVMRRKWDVVVAAPGLEQFEQPNSGLKYDLGYFDFAMDALGDSGTALVHLPHSELTGKRSLKYRKRLLTEFRVDCMVHQAYYDEFEEKFVNLSALVFLSKMTPGPRVQMISGLDYWGWFEFRKEDPLRRQCCIESIRAFLSQPTSSTLAQNAPGKLKILKLLEQNASQAMENLGLSSIHSDAIEFEETDTKSALRLVRRAINHLNKSARLDDPVAFREAVPVSEMIFRDYDLTYPRTSNAEYMHFIDGITKTHGARVLALKEIAELHAGRKCHPGQLRQDDAAENQPEGQKIRVFTGRNDRGKNNRELNLAAIRQSLTDQAALDIRKDELLRTDDILITISGEPGRITRIQCLHEALLDGAPLTEAIASDRHVVVRMRGSSESLLTTDFVACLLASPPYQEAINFLSFGSQPRKINIQALAEIKIPLLPPEKQLLLQRALMQEGATAESLLGSLDRHLISTGAIQAFNESNHWKQLAEQAVSQPTPAVRNTLSELVTIHTRQLSDRGADAKDPFQNWSVRFVEIADELLRILNQSLSAEQIFSIKRWRTSLAQDSHPYPQAWKRLRDALENDEPDIRDAVITRCRDVFEALRTLSRRCEHDLTIEFQARSEVANHVTELWDISRRLRITDQAHYILPFLNLLAGEPRVLDALRHRNENAFDAALFQYSARSSIHHLSVEWFRATRSQISKTEQWEILEHAGNFWARQGDAGAHRAIRQYLRKIPERFLSRSVAEAMFPSEVISFMLEAAHLHAPADVHFPFAPFAGLTELLPKGIEPHYQFRTDYEAGVFAIHELADDHHSSFAIADPTVHWNPFGRKFNAVIATPPFNARLRGDAQSIENHCIDQALAELDTHGRLVMSVSNGYLSRGGRHLHYREQLVSNGLLEAVIHLPARLLAGTVISFSLLVLRRGGEESRSVRFIDATDCVSTQGSDNLPKLDLAELWERWNNQTHPRCRIVNITELERSDFDFTATRYTAEEVEIPENHSLIPLEKLISPLRFPHIQPDDLGIPLTPRILESHDSVEPSGFEDLKILKAGELARPRNIRRVNGNALIINSALSKSGLAACLFQHKGADLFLRPDMMAYEVNAKLVDPQWLLLALRSESTRRQLEHHKTTSGIARVSAAQLRWLQLAVPNLLEQQRALVSFHKESQLKSRARELGLEEHLRSLKSGFIDDLRIKKHSMSQVLNSIKSAVGTLSRVLEMNGSISAEQIISRNRSIAFKEYLELIRNDCSQLGNLVEKLTAENSFDDPVPLDIIKELKRIVKSPVSDGIEVSIQVDELSFANPRDNQPIKPIVSIAPATFTDLCRNIIENARRHGFRNGLDGACILVEAVFLQEEQMLEVVFMNNGLPLPEGMNTRRFTLRGEKAGESGNTGTGGYHIKSIMDHVGGALELVSAPDHSFPVQLKLLFPINHDHAI